MKTQESTNLWVEVTRDLTRRIESGEYPVGTNLPTELELCAIYAVSRFTIRAALKLLQEKGIVTRRKNAGTRVEASHSQNFSVAPSSMQQLALYGFEYPREFVAAKTVKATRPLAETLSCAVGQEWVHLSFVRTSEGQRHSWIDVYIRPEYADVVEHVRANPGILTSTLIERRHKVHVASIQQQISAVTCTASVAKQVGTHAGDSALRIQRQYMDDKGRVVEVSVTTFAASRYKHITYLRRT